MTRFYGFGFQGVAALRLCICFATLKTRKRDSYFFSRKDPYRTREHHQTCPKNRSYFFGVSFYVGNMKMPSSLDRRVGTQRRSEQPKTGEDVLSMFTPPKLLRVRRRKRKEGGRGRDCNHPARNGKEKDGDCDVAFPRRRREIYNNIPPPFPPPPLIRQAYILPYVIVGSPPF